jgi:hypothetical protein
MRFLEQERLTYSSGELRRDQINRENLERGNEAAHHGNGIADGAVLRNMARNGLDTEEYKELFNLMYRNPDPHVFQSWPPKIRQAIDLVVSVRAGEGVHGGLGTEDQRNTVARLVEIL